MKNKVIIHISDLHVTDASDENINSYLTTNDVDSNRFLNEFITKVKGKYKIEETIFYLIITGDISNQGKKSEFSRATQYIKKKCSDLSINTENCLIIPGDHDIFRPALANHIDNKPNSDNSELNRVKFDNFSEFYTSIKSNTFCSDKIIVDYLKIEDNLILLGLNSNLNIGCKGGLGYISIDEFEKEFNSLRAEFGSDTHFIISCHHNFTANYENTNSGQWESENRIDFLALIERLQIKLALCGNEHTSATKQIDSYSVLTSDCGSFSAQKDHTSFKIYPIDISSEKISLKNNIYALQKTNHNDKPYFWSLMNNADAKQVEEFVLYTKNIQEIKQIEEIPRLSEEGEKKNINISQEKSIDRIFYDNSQISEKLYQIVKDNNLFHSGHFHWSETSRAHNWIDISKLLENKEDLLFAKNAVVDVIEKFNIQENCDLIIGLGYEGNIISSKASIKFEIPYAALPYSYRYDEHHDFEKKMNFNNNGQFKRVLIITDVVNDGRTIRKLIAKREIEFFEKVEKIMVVSLFYTGTREVNHNILNTDSFPGDYDFENDHIVSNMEFYTVKSLRVERCPYKADYKESCFIYKDSLNCVHLFYNEE